jgi:excisionase family DNA binding protein
MTLTEAAAELGVDASTLRHQIRRGSLRARKVGRDWTVSRRELARYRADHLGRRRPGALTVDTPA